MNRNITTTLKELVELQEADSRLFELLKLRGSLPAEVEALKKHIEQLYEDISAKEAFLVALQEEMVAKKAFIKDTEKKVQKCESYQTEVRDNKEYDALTKELELYVLDIQLAEKFLRTAYEKTEQNTTALAELKQLVVTKEKELLVKKKELEEILQANEAEEHALNQRKQKLHDALGEAVYVAYERIRKNVHNNLAVVPIRKGACGGCCIVIPPQQKLEVYEGSKIVLCEHCGRMLVSSGDQSINTQLFVTQPQA